MNRALHTIVRLGIAAVVGGGVLFLHDGMLSKDSASLVSSAEARIGRPLTPLSYAGVARRTTRRTVAAAGAAAAVAPVVVAPAPVVVAPAPRCVQTVDAYGRIYRRCY